VGRTRDGGVQIGVRVFDYNGVAAYFGGNAAELILSTFRTIEIPETHYQSFDLAKGIHCEAVKGEAQAPPGVVAYWVGDTEVPGTNLNRHKE
jgi:hypothetical protein